MITAPSLITNNDVKDVAKHDSKIGQAHILATLKSFIFLLNFGTKMAEKHLYFLILKKNSYSTQIFSEKLRNISKKIIFVALN